MIPALCAIHIDLATGACHVMTAMHQGGCMSHYDCHALHSMACLICPHDKGILRTQRDMLILTRAVACVNITAGLCEATDGLLVLCFDVLP